jgi:putative ABC transport system permease protein
MILVSRRALRDLLFLIGWTALVALTLLLAIAAPRMVISTVDRGARDAVAAAGDRTDLLVTAAVGLPNGSDPVITPDGMITLADSVPGHLPPALTASYGDSVLTVLGPEAAVLSIDGVRPADSTVVRMAMLTPAQLKAMDVVAGAVPQDAGASGVDPIDIMVTRSAAALARLSVGSLLDMPPPAFGDRATGGTLRVAAIVDRSDPASTKDAELWSDLPGLWAPTVTRSDTGSRSIGLTVLATPAGVGRAGAVSSTPFAGLVRIRLDPESFTSGRIGQVADEVTALEANGDSLSFHYAAAIGARSEFPQALGEYPPRARAAIAQMSLMIAGVLGAAVTVVLMISRMLVLRRAGELALERARGASLSSIALRATLESLVAAVAAGSIGIGIALLLLPDAAREPLPAILVLAVAVAAPPAYAVLLTRRHWAGRREPANRKDRHELHRKATTRRFVIEGALVVLAAAALSSIRTRGLLQTRTDGIDPLLSVAPLLLAGVVTIVLLRLYPVVIRAIAAGAGRSRGVAGVLGAMQLRRSLAALPLLALTLAASLAVGGGLLIETVSMGQDDASWQRVGADARVDASLSGDQVSRVASSTGVVAAASLHAEREVSITAVQVLPTVTVLAIDHRYPDFIARLPATAGGMPTARVSGLRRLAAPVSSEQPLPVIVDRRLARLIGQGTFRMRFGYDDVPIRVAGTFDGGPTGYRSAPFLYVDLTALQARVTTPITATTLLVVGPGAAGAVSALGIPSADVLTRAGWVAGVQKNPLNSGVTAVMLLSSAALAALAMMALLAMVLASSRARTRSLALLRTLGMGARWGWWLAFTELAPVVLAAVTGGALAGSGMVLLIAPSLGLSHLTGGLADPEPRVSVTLIIGVALSAVAILGIATLVEVVAHRRDRLNDLLRVGETG